MPIFVLAQIVGNSFVVTKQKHTKECPTTGTCPRAFDWCS